MGGCLSPFLASANLASSFLGGKKDFKHQSLYFGIWGSGIPIVALICTVLCTNDPLWFVVVYSLSNLLSSLSFYKKTLELYRPDPAKKDTGMLSYGKHLSFIGILGGIAGNLDQILLFHYVGAAELAIYNFATAILDQTSGPLKTLGSMLVTSFASHSEKSIGQNMSNKVWWLAALAVTIIVVYLPLAPYIYQVLFPGYVAAVPYSQLYAFSLLSIIFTPFGSYIVAKKKLTSQYVSSIGSYSIQIIFMVVGVLWGGLWGLIVSRVVIRLCGGLLVCSLYYRDIRSTSSHA